MFSKRLIAFFVLTICYSTSFAQLNVKQHSPKKASIYSAVLPGAGQFYNRKYWKIPIIYLGIGASFSIAEWNKKEYAHYLLAYEYRTDGDDSTIDPYVDRYTESNLNTIKNYHRKNRDLAYIIAAGIYLLNIVDASVDAHLFDFNINDDLSLNLQPSFSVFQGNNIPSLSLTLNLN